MSNEPNIISSKEHRESLRLDTTAHSTAKGFLEGGMPFPYNQTLYADYLKHEGINVSQDVFEDENLMARLVVMVFEHKNQNSK